MISLRPVVLETDHPMLMGWWARRGANLMPMAVFPKWGFVAEEDGVPLAMSFLYLDVGGTFSMIEWTSTNPDVGFSRSILTAVKTLYEALERMAREAGCLVVTSMVAPNTGEQRIMKRMGYQGQSVDEPAHLMYVKSLVVLPSCVHPCPHP